MSSRLSTLKMMLPSLRAGLAATQNTNAYLNPVNAAARIATGKWTIEEDAFVSAQGSVFIIPGRDKPEFYHRILHRSMAAPVTMVPLYMAEHFRKSGSMRVTKAEDQYIIPAERMRDLPGKALKRLRQYANSLAGDLTFTHWRAGEGADIPFKELLEVNRVWYREAQDRYFRTSEKTQIDWMITEWPTVMELDPCAVLSLTREKASGRLLSFNIGTQLYPGMACTIVERYVRDGLRNANFSGLRAHIAVLGEPEINDGPAGSREVADLKTKLSDGRTHAFFTVERRRK